MNWTTIESDPGVFTELIHKLGCEDVDVEEVYSFDDKESIKQMGEVYGFIYLFHYDVEILKKINENNNKSVFWDQDLFYAYQTINNACATQSILSILLNNKNINLPNFLKEFKEFSNCLDYESRGYAIGESNKIRLVHNEFGKNEEGFEFTNDLKIGKSEDAFHFISFINYNNNIWELDGLKKDPLLVDKIEDGKDFFDIVIKDLQNRISFHGDKEIRFTLLAVKKSKKKIIQEKIYKTLNNNYNINSNCQIYKNVINELILIEALKIEDYSNTSNEINFENVANSLKNLLEDYKDNLMILEKYKKENERRKHSYIPMIMEIFKIGAEKDVILNSYEKFKNN